MPSTFPTVMVACCGLSGGDDRSILRWPQRGVCLLRRRPPIHPVRQHQAGGCPDPGRWGSGSERASSRSFSSHYLFEDRFGRPGKGNDKGKVEGLVGFIRRNFLVPVPRAESFAALNDALAEQCRRRQAARRAATRRPSASVSSGIVKFSCHCRLLPMMPAISALDGRVRCRWCVTAATTIPCPWPTATVRCSSGATSMRW